ncbi:hypothetical protein [Streptomyces canus]|uniref:hypothetical protein n=1 Tax=Streptomyces canus TaxID=58343 RepID=UPI0038294B30
MTDQADTARPEVDDPRVLALAKARQQIAYESPLNFVCPPWDGLTEDEQHTSLLDARNYLHAALKAGLAPAAVVPPEGQADLRDRIAAALYERERPPGTRPWAEAVTATRGVFEAQADAVLAVLPAPVDRAAARPTTLNAIASHLEARASRIFRPDAEVYTEYNAVAALLRRRAAEATSEAAELAADPWADGGRLAQTGIDTPGCDCGHTGMGEAWHGDACEWKSLPPCDHCKVRGHSFEDCPAAEAPATEEQDTLPAWLYQRFSRSRPNTPAWDRLMDEDRSYWEHHARAVRRAVERNGFREPAAPQPAQAHNDEDGAAS